MTWRSQLNWRLRSTFKNQNRADHLPGFDSTFGGGALTFLPHKR